MTVSRWSTPPRDPELSVDKHRLQSRPIPRSGGVGHKPLTCPGKIPLSWGETKIPTPACHLSQLETGTESNLPLRELFQSPTWDLVPGWAGVVPFFWVVPQPGPICHGRFYQGAKASQQHSPWDPRNTETPPPKVEIYGLLEPKSFFLMCAEAKCYASTRPRQPEEKIRNCEKNSYCSFLNQHWQIIANSSYVSVW